MLGPGRYLLGVAEIGLLIGFAWLGASSLASRLLPRFQGATAFLATTVLSFALLLLVAELLGSFGVLAPLPYLIGVALSGVLLRLSRGWRGRGDHPRGSFSYRSGVVGPCRDRTRGPTALASLIAFLIAAAAVVHFAIETKTKLGTGMTGFDSTWYHGPFAAGFFQSGDTWSLHFIAPQFLAWFYPANSEVVHAIGMLAFSRDILSPLLNLGWLIGCLLAAWCIGKPYRVAPWSMALAAIALSVPALSDQAGEARNDIVGIFFLLAAVVIVLAQSESSSTDRQVGTAFGLGPAAVAGLSAGIAAGTKLNFLLPAAVLIVGMAVVARDTRWKTLGVGIAGALLGGGYWYLRNLAHAGNPLPWVKHLGPITLPAPEQALGGREGHSVLGYLSNGSVWSHWFLPGLHHGLTILWPVLGALALASLLICTTPLFRCAFSRHRGGKAHRNGGGVLVVVGLAGLAAALAWLIAPTSASGPDGIPRGFESGLRYLAPALVLGLALLPTALPARLREAGMGHLPNGRILEAPSQLARRLSGRGMLRTCLAIAAVLAVIAIGYQVQRHYLRNRYADPTFTTPGLNAAFEWAQGISGARIATTSTRQYPLFGADLGNRVAYLGEEQPHGGFTAPATCRRWRHLLDAGNYDYVVTTYDRLEPGNPPYPPTARWTEALGATVVLRKPPTVVFQLNGRLDPSAC